ncbi:hypothetical protein ACLOJK_033192 [Asimina triloba]
MDKTILPIHRFRCHYFPDKVLISRSAKLARIVREDENHQLHHDSYVIQDMPGDASIFELAVKFCYGDEPELSSDNAIPLTCLASELEMIEEHSSNNLVKKTTTFLQTRILPDWNESVRALRSSGYVIGHAIKLGLLDACLDSIAGKAFVDPILLGRPIQISPDDRCHLRPSARRKLFAAEGSCFQEDLSALSLRLYELVMLAVIRDRVPSKNIAASIYNYCKTWADLPIVIDGVTTGEKIPQREVIEVVEKLLPDEVGVLPCSCLFKMLNWAIASQACEACRQGLEFRIVNQLEEAAVEDLLIPCYGYSRDAKYDVECVGRLVRAFYSNCGGGEDQDLSGVMAVSELVDGYLAEIGKDVNLKKGEFQELLEMSAAVCNKLGRCSDGIYQALDVYLCAHAHLNDAEREELCQVLDCNRMTAAACQHAARNERLPLRVAMQLLFAGQLSLRDAIAGALPESDSGCQEEEGEEEEEDEEEEKELDEAEEEEEEKEKVVVGGDDGVGRVKEEIERMDCRVVELEREYCEMKKEIKRGGEGDLRLEKKTKKKKQKKSFWRDVRRKVGCKNSLLDCRNSHAKSRISGNAKP